LSTERLYEPLYTVAFRRNADQPDTVADVCVRVATSGETATRQFPTAALDGGPSDDNVDLANWIADVVADLLTGGATSRTDYRTSWTDG